MNHLDRLALLYGKCGPKAFVAANNFFETPAQTVNIQLPRKSQAYGYVVRPAFLLELVNKPKSALRIRKRERKRTGRTGHSLFKTCSDGGIGQSSPQLTQLIVLNRRLRRLKNIVERYALLRMRKESRRAGTITGAIFCPPRLRMRSTSSARPATVGY